MTGRNKNLLIAVLIVVVVWAIVYGIHYYRNHRIVNENVQIESENEIVEETKQEIEEVKKEVEEVKEEIKDNFVESPDCKEPPKFSPADGIKPAPQVKPVPEVKPNEPNEPKPNPDANINKGSYISEIEQSIFVKVSQERVKSGLKPYAYNDTMQNFARIKSADMGDRNYFSHEDPEGNLITKKMAEYGITYKAWGENIALIQGEDLSQEAVANQFMKQWMNSEGHRANILSNNFSDIGIGVYYINGTYYATQEFFK